MAKAVKKIHSKKRVESNVSAMSVDAQARMFANMGMIKKNILNTIMTTNPDKVCCIKDTASRKEAAAVLGLEVVPPYSEKAYVALYEQVGKVESDVKKSRQDMDTTEDSGVYRKGDIKYIPMRRISTGIELLDHLFGNTKEFNESGVPRGTVVLLCGEHGVGKSKTLLTISQHMGMAFLDSKKDDCGGVLYIQTEVAPSQFVGMMEGIISDDTNFRFSPAKTLNTIIAQIQKYKPDVVILDSIQEVEDAKSAAGMQQIVTTLKALAQTMNFAGFVIGQMNKKKEVAGSNKLPHLVDIVLLATKWHIPGHFNIACNTKNRYGATGRNVQLRHVDGGPCVCCDSRRIDKVSGEAVEGNNLAIVGAVSEITGDLPSSFVEEKDLDAPVFRISSAN